MRVYVPIHLRHPYTQLAKRCTLIGKNGTNNAYSDYQITYLLLTKVTYCWPRVFEHGRQVADGPIEEGGNWGVVK